MAKTTLFSTYFYLLLLANALFSVNGDVCYKVIPNVPCLDKELGTKCLPACEKACGLSVLAICINPGPGLGYNCACSIVVPDCSKKRPC